MSSTFWSRIPGLGAELEALEALLEREFAGTGFLQASTAKLVTGGGKRLRPALVIASAKLGQYERGKALPVAAALEALHTATLVHDDVIDGAETRRGMPTLHGSLGNHVAIYAGDYILAKAVLLISSSDLPNNELKRMAQAISAMCVGEVAQYIGRGRVPGYREYLKRIMGKTGILFAAACAAGGRSGGLDDRAIMLLWRFGMRLGAAFQIRDDILDMEGADGKPSGRDLADGIVTLPILLAAANEDFRRALDIFFRDGMPEGKAPVLLDAARSLGAIDKTRQVLEEEVGKGLKILTDLPDGEGREMLRSIACAIC